MGKRERVTEGFELIGYVDPDGWVVHAHDLSWNYPSDRHLDCTAVYKRTERKPTPRTLTVSWAPEAVGAALSTLLDFRARNIDAIHPESRTVMVAIDSLRMVAGEHGGKLTTASADSEQQGALQPLSDALWTLGVRPPSEEHDWAWMLERAAVVADALAEDGYVVQPMEALDDLTIEEALSELVEVLDASHAEWWDTRIPSVVERARRALTEATERAPRGAT